jgi:hypothetical protein
LHVEPIEPAHVPCGVDAVQGYRGHGLYVHNFNIE